MDGEGVSSPRRICGASREAQQKARLRILENPKKSDWRSTRAGVKAHGLAARKGAGVLDE
jgi:hypothetical protein